MTATLRKSAMESADLESMLAACRSREVKAGDFLYEAGERRRCVFRVVSGTIALYRCQRVSNAINVSVTFDGSYIGLGYSDHYVENARAISDSRVLVLPLAELPQIAAVDDRFRELQGDAVEREFDELKMDLVQRGANNSSERVAAFLVCVSRQNRDEGRDPLVMGDTLTCGTVAMLLGIDIDTLSDVLNSFQRHEIIEPGMGGALRIRSVDRLKAIADGVEVGDSSLH